MSMSDKRHQFWNALAWHNNRQVLRIKKLDVGNKEKPFKFSFASWSSCLTVEHSMYDRNHVALVRNEKTGEAVN